MASHSIVTPMRSPTLSLLARTVLLSESRVILVEGQTRDVRYSSPSHLRDVLRPLLSSAWEDVRAEAIRRFPQHRVVLGRTRFVPIMPGDPKPKGVLSGEYEIQTAEFVSKCDDLFATTRAGTKCRAEGNLANPPTHNAIYADMVKILGLSGIPASGVFRWKPDDLEEILTHEMSHAIDRLSSVVQGEQIRDSQDQVVADIFDWDALKDRSHFMDQVEDRLIQAGASDDEIDRMLAGFGDAWDHYVKSGWLLRRGEQVATAIQLVSVLNTLGVSGKEFLEMNIADGSGDLSAACRGTLDYGIAMVYYGVLDDAGVIGLEGIRGEAM